METKLTYSKTDIYFKFSKTQKKHTFFLYTFQKLMVMITRMVNWNYSSSMMSKLININ